MLPSYQEINEKIVSECYNENEAPEHEDISEWTEYIKLILSSIKPTGVEIYENNNNYEYLLDYVWSYEKKNSEYWKYHGLALAMECEWDGSEEEFWKDFIKLADIRADRKIFVAGLKTTLYKNRENLIQKIKMFLSNHRHFGKEEKILILFWDKGKSEEGESFLIKGDGIVQTWSHEKWTN
jgi:hypothetical protein